MSIEQVFTPEPLGLFDSLTSPGVVAIAAIAAGLTAGIIIRSLAKKRRAKLVGKAVIITSAAAAVLSTIAFLDMSDTSPRLKEVWPAVEEGLTEKYTLQGASPVTDNGNPVTSGGLADKSLLWVEDLSPSLNHVGHPGPKTAVLTEDGHRYIYNVTIYNGNVELRHVDLSDTPTPKPEELLRDRQN